MAKKSSGKRAPKKPAARIREGLKLLNRQRKALSKSSAVRSESLVASQIEACERLTKRLPPEYEFVIRRAYELERFLELPDGQAPFGVSCVPIVSGVTSLAADLRYSQRWLFRRLNIGDISSSIALAPSEELTLTIKKTQRTQLTETTMRSSESLDAFESSIVDKDVLNVQRSTTSTMNWRVDGNATLSLGGVFSLGASGGIGGSTTSSSNSNIQQISESTQKSSRRLQALQKIEVARQSEIAVEDLQTRKIANPYRDRSLSLHVFELNKGYTVQTGLEEIRPLLVLEITDLDMRRDFVLAQGEFLDEALLDRTLQGELQGALQDARQPLSSTNRNLAHRYARFAFHVLFEDVGMFNLDAGSSAENDPRHSFQDDEGLDDAINNEAGRIFTTLGAYFRLHEDIYRKLIPPPQPHTAVSFPAFDATGHDLEVELALSLAESIRAEWTALTPDIIKNLTDVGDKTTVLRRVSGFLSLVDGLLKPLLKPIEEEAEAAATSRRAESVIERVINHIECNKAFYVQQFLEYIQVRTHGFALSDVLRRILVSGRTQNLQFPVDDLLQIFNLQQGFLDGFQFIVPADVAFDPAAGATWIDTVTEEKGPQAPLGNFDVDQRDVVIPTDGYYLEPIPGECVLPDLRDPTSSVTANINVEAQGP